MGIETQIGNRCRAVGQRSRTHAGEEEAWEGERGGGGGGRGRSGGDPIHAAGSNLRQDELQGGQTEDDGPAGGAARCPEGASAGAGVCGVQGGLTPSSQDVGFTTIFAVSPCAEGLLATCLLRARI